MQGGAERSRDYAIGLDWSANGGRVEWRRVWLRPVSTGVRRMERGGNAGYAQWRRLPPSRLERYASYFTPSLSRTFCGAPFHTFGTLPW
jgi:hypothetical protein